MVDFDVENLLFVEGGQGHRCSAPMGTAIMAFDAFWRLPLCYGIAAPEWAAAPAIPAASLEAFC